MGVKIAALFAALVLQSVSASGQTSATFSYSGSPLSTSCHYADNSGLCDLPNQFDRTRFSFTVSGSCANRKILVNSLSGFTYYNGITFVPAFDSRFSNKYRGTIQTDAQCKVTSYDVHVADAYPLLFPTQAEFSNAIDSVKLSYTGSVHGGAIITGSANPSAAYWSVSGAACKPTLSAGQYFNPANGHVYQYMANPWQSWQQAEAVAEATVVGGAPGYLATITSQAELDFIESIIPGGASVDNTYIGGYLVPNSGATYEWAVGPEKGTVFWQNGPVAGEFATWYGGNPTSDPGAPAVQINAYLQPQFHQSYGKAIVGAGAGGATGYVVEWSAFTNCN